MKHAHITLQTCAVLLLLGSAGAVLADSPRPAAAVRPTLTNFQMLPASVIGGKPIVGTLTLNNPAPNGGAIITLLSNNKAVQPVRSVSIPAGMKTVNFPINTFPVLSDANATLSAAYQGVTRTASLAVHPVAASLLGVYTDAQEGTGGGGAFHGTVLLSAKAPAGGAVIALESSSAALTVPATVTVPAGNTSVIFTVTPNTVEKDTQVNLTATYNNVSRSSRFIVRAQNIQPLALSLFAEDVMGGDTGYLNIVLSGVATQPVVVTITSDNSFLLSVSRMEIIPVGYDGLQIPFHTASVTKNVAVNVSARITGSSSSTSITVFAPRPPSPPQ